MRTLVALLLALTAWSLGAQRRITPIDNPSTATQHINERLNTDSLDRSKLVEMTDAQGRKILVDTITGTEVVDSTELKVVPKMEQPLFYGVSLGVDIWDPVMRLFGQNYGLVSFSAELNLHNRYIPVFEFGLGEANDTPDDNNYTYRSKMAPFFKIGMNYNFLYNSNPAYMAMAGVRYGFTPFSFELTDVHINSPYWQEESPISIPRQDVTAGYIEILFNLRVKIAGPIYLGWAFKFHKVLHKTATPYGEPWYIPGYGTRTGAVTGAFSVTYTLDFGRKKKAAALLNDDGFADGMYPADLPPLHEGDDPTVTPHFHPAGAHGEPTHGAPAAEPLPQSTATTNESPENTQEL